MNSNNPTRQAGLGAQGAGEPRLQGRDRVACSLQVRQMYQMHQMQDTQRETAPKQQKQVHTSLPSAMQHAALCRRHCPVTKTTTSENGAHAIMIIGLTRRMEVNVDVSLTSPQACTEKAVHQ